MKLPHYKHNNTRRTGRVVASWCAALLIASLPAHAVAGAGAPEYAVKAAIIFKIAKFVSWPKQAFSGRREPLTVCVQKDDPIATAMSALNGKPIHGRLFSVKYIDANITKHSGCQILFFNDTRNERQISLLDAAVGQPVLTIGNNDKFIDRGGIIGLEISQNRVQFAINVKASETAGLDISAQLLQLAKISANHKGTQ